MDGDYEQAIELVEKSRNRFSNDMLFAYNTACVYSRALEQVQKDEEIPDRDKKIEQYRQKALEDLKRSVQMGFRDFDWMQKDPDLEPLHDVPEFKEIHSPSEEAKDEAARRPRAVPVPVPVDGPFEEF
jgi:hypothetical protein